MSMELNIRELTSDAFRPYGSVIQQPAFNAEAHGNGWQWWSETAQVPPSESPYSVGWLALQPAALAFDWAEYHLRSKEAIIPLGEECLIYVGAPGAEPVWDAFEVFRIRQGQGVILDEGVWHGAPLATGGPLSTLVLLRQGTGDQDVYKETNPDGPIDIVKRP
jgi:ureidoglycolate hydrolase